MKRIYFLFAIIAIVVLTAQAFSEADADAEAEASNMQEIMKKLCTDKKMPAWMCKMLGL
uniref:Venom peptide ECTX1-Rm9a n=1 Tax=Rhytidoponera metallica TaxID=148364 RepID=A0A8U0LTH0_RHYMT|nr:venom peptide precursor ECTX1-Rm9a [Rhytidoponera metallica]